MANLAPQCSGNGSFAGSSAMHSTTPLEKYLDQEEFMDINHLRSVLHVSGSQLPLFSVWLWVKTR
jgi:hypothetical protein